MPRKIPIYHAEVCHNSIVEFLLATSLVWLAPSADSSTTFGSRNDRRHQHAPTAKGHPL